MSSTPLHRSSPERLSLAFYLAVVSGIVAVVMATWGLSVLGGS